MLITTLTLNSSYMEATLMLMEKLINYGRCDDVQVLITHYPNFLSFKMEI